MQISVSFLLQAHLIVHWGGASLSTICKSSHPTCKTQNPITLCTIIWFNICEINFFINNFFWNYCLNYLVFFIYNIFGALLVFCRSSYYKFHMYDVWHFWTSSYCTLYVYSIHVLWIGMYILFVSKFDLHCKLGCASNCVSV
jgi:hypothetical protein